MALLNQTIKRTMGMARAEMTASGRASSRASLSLCCRAMVSGTSSAKMSMIIAARNTTTTKATGKLAAPSQGSKSLARGGAETTATTAPPKKLVSIMPNWVVASRRLASSARLFGGPRRSHAFINQLLQACFAHVDEGRSGHGQKAVQDSSSPSSRRISTVVTLFCLRLFCAWWVFQAGRHPIGDCPGWNVVGHHRAGSCLGPVSYLHGSYQHCSAADKCLLANGGGCLCWPS